MKRRESNREESHVRGRPAAFDRSNSPLAKVPRCAFLVLLCSTWSSSRTYENPHGDFVERCRLDCVIQKDPVSCTKYRVIQWFYDVSRKKELSYGSFRLVRMPVPSEESVILSRISRLRNSSGVVVEALNFARNVAEDLLIRRALVYTVDHPTGARSLAGPIILDEEELRELQDGKLNDDQRLLKKKKSIILPILVLLNLFKLKLLLIPIFLGVHFIKKFLLFGSLLAPSILAKLKYCKMPPSLQHHQHGSYPYHSWSTAAEAPVDYPTGYGHEDAWNHRSDIYQGPQGYYGAGYHGPYAGYFQGHRQQ